MRTFWLALLIMISTPVRASVEEPKELKAPSGLKEGEGVVRLSLRSQRQFIETAYLYFIEVLPDGADGTRILQFERGAGVPLMGTNMIDVKPKYYRVPSGRHRVLAYTVACSGVPPEGSVCTFYGNKVPTGRHESGSPVIEVKAGALADAGDFIIEYVKDVNLDSFDLFDDRYSNEGYGVRMRPIKAALLPSFRALALTPQPLVPSEYQSRISCEQRPPTSQSSFPSDAHLLQRLEPSAGERAAALSSSVLSRPSTRLARSDEPQAPREMLQAAEPSRRASPIRVAGSDYRPDAVR